MQFQKFLLSFAIATALCPSAHAQQGVNIATSGALTDFTTWTLFGSASTNNQTPGNGFTYSDLILTPIGSGGQAGAGFAPTALAIDFNQAFHFDFNFYIPVPIDGVGNGIRGDGLTFVLAKEPGVGGTGSDLGYGGLGSASVAFAIDTFSFEDEPVSPSLQILQAGNVSPLAVTETGLGESIRDPNFQWYASVDYTPSGDNDHRGLLTGTIYHLDLGTFSVSAPVDFDALGLVDTPVFYGFTAGNGLASDGHIVTSAVPIPEPQQWALLLAGLAALSLSVRRRVG